MSARPSPRTSARPDAFRPLLSRAAAGGQDNDFRPAPAPTARPGTRAVLAILLALAVVAGPAPARASGGGAHWGYDGHVGPDNWANLAADYAACGKGAEQSPINLTGAVTAHLDMPELHWSPNAEWTALNNGHTIQAKAADAGQMRIDDTDYALLQVHFHHPSEHAIDGQRQVMEAHFVHRAADGRLAVLGVMLTGGGDRGPLDAILAAAPGKEGEAHLGQLDLTALIPGDSGFWRYRGSLTTPPCSEIVLWTMMQQPVQVSDAAIAAFSALYPMDARPLQPLNRRYLLAN